MLFIVLLGLLLSANQVKQVHAQNCVVEPTTRKLCGNGAVTTNNECLALGCCWARDDDRDIPWCFHSSEAQESGYKLISLTETSTGYTGLLAKNVPNSLVYGADIPFLSLNVYYNNQNTLRVKITDANSTRYEIPQSIIPRSLPDAAPAELDMSISFVENPFSFEVKRKSDAAVLFKSADQLVFKDQYIELSSVYDPSLSTFGLGESTRANHKLRTNETYTLWAADVMALMKNSNLYGSYPFYIQKASRGPTHGALLMNSNGMDIVLLDSLLTFRVIGGIIDLYVFSGPSPSNVVQQYTSLVGRPAMMPYWTLGFHSCRWGYNNIQHVKDVVKNYSIAGIPLDTQWLDIDYMDEYRDFTLSPTNFPVDEVAAFVKQLHADGQHFMPILDPGIMVYPNHGYSSYDIALKQGLFVKDLTGGNYQGKVWPGPVYYPDFLHPDTQDYWTQQVVEFYKVVDNDGMWIDMNEVSNFCNVNGKGQVCTNPNPATCPDPEGDSVSCCLECTTVDDTNKYDFPPYKINHFWGPISAHTMAMSAQHYNNVSAYDVHNLYGLTETIATVTAMQQARGKRPFVLSRSSFMSTGHHGAKWTGDNGATWQDLKASIVGMMDFNLFGVPMIGSDICGFMLESNEELCTRWIEVGAYYPFSRNHNTKKQPPQELYLWESTTEAAKKALALRYRLLPYMYTLFAQAHFHGTTVAHAIWMVFPEDEVTLNIDDQFMLGTNVLVSPVLAANTSSVLAYFPQGLWYPISSGVFGVEPISAVSRGHRVLLPTPLTDTNVHVRGGSILPLQDAAMTTTVSRQSNFTLLVSLSVHGNASGALFWDDGEQIEIKEYLHARYVASLKLGGLEGQVLGSVLSNSYPAASALRINAVIVTGGGVACPSKLFVRVSSPASSPYGAPSVSCVAGSNATNAVSYGQFTATNLDIPLSAEFSVEWLSA